MAYFSSFPNTIFEINGKDYVVKDIFRRCMFISEYKPYSDLYTTYTVNDGESPQMIAHKLYDSAEHDWVLLMFNEIHNPYFDWPMGQLDLENYVKGKYGESIMYMTKHYTKDGMVVGEVKEWVDGSATWTPPANPGGLVSAVSFMDYETALNDERRIIHILRPELLSDFIAQFDKAINGDFR